MLDRLTTILILVILGLSGCSYSPKQTNESPTQKETILDEPTIWEEDDAGLTHEYH